ncbi:ribosome maturation factor RimP [Paraclostridium sordellii]|uniref:ribosome maturation factor RimP n=1 Tax=Paraclostridium sordellii TaxID=1505 RepID=UPI0005E9B726|nr:ribosome maturation factor RimP [Paeniclostridium sordellii]CEO05921.1 ribosome maturation factor RimP [[Clostridium] sordellii] [Paeniclostridium sordellii]CEP86285.1 ribosome maturation factor RimP [[Clostridium] sordellii] [Paeniclostridium sordellii]CEP96537.1 ribosome maturation factor RimP [[Clostridium] sordellii] [Paeniclostridium sordellii]CEP99997.1 ribosome maturation factor RimP [[Clostridium] sordellii] [Paeniclostridium sordellii]
MKKSTEALVEELVLPITNEHNIELVDVEYVKEAGEYYLRIFIDKDGGVSLNDCEVVTRAINPILDEKDPIKENYFLEVSSPGLDRPLKKEKDFIRYAGRDVEVKLYRPINKLKHFEAELVELVDNKIVKLVVDGEEMEFNKKDIALIRLAIKF